MLRPLRQPNRPCEGFTLLELAIYLAVALAVGAPLISIVLTSSGAVSQTDSTTKIQERNRVARLQVERDLREAIASTLVVTASSVQLTIAQSHNGTSLVPGDTVRYVLRLSGDESANGSDDNGNGLADEGILVRQNVTLGQEATLCGGVDLSQSSFSMSGTAVTFTLTTMGAVQRATPVFVTSSTTLSPYNN